MNMVFTSIIQSRNFKDNKDLYNRFKSKRNYLDLFTNDTESYVIIDDSVLGVLCMKYFNNIGFSNIIVYHKGYSSRSIPGNTQIKTIGMFDSDNDVREAMKRDAFLTIII